MLTSMPEDQPQPDARIELPKPKPSASAIPRLVFLVVCMALFAFLFYSYLRQC
jgi:hypothetical protein